MSEWKEIESAPDAANRRLLDVTEALGVMIESKWRAAESATKDGDEMGAFGFTSQASTLREILLLLQSDKTEATLNPPAPEKDTP